MSSEATAPNLPADLLPASPGPACPLSDTPLVIPVRHHSPACARLVRDLIRVSRPRVVLIEGPSDATHLIPALVDPEAHPPIALMAYFQPGPKSRRSDDQQPAPDARSSATEERPSLFYPFCEYSPEWVAMREGCALGADVRFCDLPAGPMLLRSEDARSEHEAPSAAQDDAPERSIGTEVALAYRRRTHEEWWEALFEGQVHETGQLMRLLQAYGTEVAKTDDAVTDLRERWMWRSVEDAIDAGLPPGKIVLVCGAAHAVHFPLARTGRIVLPKTPPVEFALTPYSYPHLSQRRGYGAGNRSPLLYQKTWRLGDLRSAVAASLVEVGARLRDSGWDASTADAIAACSMATQLAGLRDKVSPGGDEVMDSARAVWPSERAGCLESVVEEVLVGTDTGSLGRSAGESPLATDVYRRARGFWRSLDATEREERLRLTDPVEIAKSAFLHQLRVAGIEFAHMRDAASRADPRAGLWNRYEVWIRAWRPETAITIAELSPVGASLIEVARITLDDTLERRSGIVPAVGVLLDAVACGLDDLLPPALVAVDEASVLDLNWEDLAHATARLARLCLDAALPGAVASATADLAGRLFARSRLHLGAASRCTDDRSRLVAAALVELHGAAVSARSLDEDVWWATLDSLTTDETAHPYLSGLAASLLQAKRRISSDRFGRLLRYRLSACEDAEAGAEFIEGILSLNRDVLLRSHELAAALNDYVDGLNDERFISLLPVLRRSFNGLSRAEMSTFVGALVPLLTPDSQESRVTRPPSQSDALEQSRACLGRLFEEGLDLLEELRPALQEHVETLISSDDPAVHAASQHLLALLNLPPESRAPSLMTAWRSLEAVRLRSDTARGVRATAKQRVHGLSLLLVAEDEAQDEPVASRLSPGDPLYQVVVDGARSTRPSRVCLVAEAAAGPAMDEVEGLLPLLAHGDYTRILRRSFSRREDPLDIARRCLAYRNPLIRRSGLEIAAACLDRDEAERHSADPHAPDALDLLAAGLLDPDLWPGALRLLRQRPASGLEWAQSRAPVPESASRDSRAELQLARLCRTLSSTQAAIPWLRRCAVGPDRVALDAMVSLGVLGEVSEGELQWSLQGRKGRHAALMGLRYEIETGARAIFGLEEMLGVVEDLPELLASLDDRLIGQLAERVLFFGSDSKKGAPLVELIGMARSPRAVPALCPIVSAAGPLLGKLAAEGLGRTGSEQAVSCLLSRNPTRSSDADRAVISSLGRIGDIRIVETLTKRLAGVRPEEVLDYEMDALIAVGEPLRLALGSWLESASVTLRACAEHALATVCPDVAATWAEKQPDPERIRQIAARMLLQIGVPADLERQMLSVARNLGGLAAPVLVQALRAASGRSEASLVRVLTDLKQPAVILPLLRVSRSAPWKKSIPEAMGDAAVPQLTVAMQDPEPFVREAALDALQAIGTPAALAAAQASPAAGPTKRRKK